MDRPSNSKKDVTICRLIKFSPYFIKYFFALSYDPILNIKNLLPQLALTFFSVRNFSLDSFLFFEGFSSSGLRS